MVNFKKFKIGYYINNDELINALLFFKKVIPVWEDKIRQDVKPGIVIEKLRGNSKIKVFVMLGKVIGYYILNDWIISLCSLVFFFNLFLKMFIFFLL